MKGAYLDLKSLAWIYFCLLAVYVIEAVVAMVGVILVHLVDFPKLSILIISVWVVVTVLTSILIFADILRDDTTSLFSLLTDNCWTEGEK